MPKHMDTYFGTGKRKRVGWDKPRRSQKRKTRRASGGAEQGSNRAVVPRRKFKNLYYHDTIAINDAGGDFNYIFKVNSLFDPDLTGVGHQPRGLDQWAAFYRQYKVHAVKATVRFNGDPQQTGLKQTLNGTMYWGHDAVDLGFNTSAEVSGETVQATTTKPGYISQYREMKQIVGRKDITEDRFSGLFTSDPANLVHMTLSFENCNKAVNVIGAFSIDLKFYTEFEDNIAISAS